MDPSQLIIAIFGVTSIWLTQSSNREHVRWACIVALFAQPAWFWTTWHAQQWGMFFLCFFYTACWLRGVWTFWIVDEIVHTNMEKDFMEVIALSETINYRLTMPHGWTAHQIALHRVEVELRYQIMQKYNNAGFKRMDDVQDEKVA